jgi:hypothetical protein
MRGAQACATPSNAGLLFEQDDVGNDLTLTGSSPITCDQQANQAAAAG